MEKTFKQYMRETYTDEELQEIAEHGCESGCASTLIYYADTNDKYDQFAFELHEVLGEWTDEIGYVPEYISKHIGNLTMFKNAVVWAVAEYYANDLLAERV